MLLLFTIKALPVSQLIELNRLIFHQMSTEKKFLHLSLLLEKTYEHNATLTN